MKRDDFEALGNKHKRYETNYNQQRLMDSVPFIVRLDGRAFHTFTKGLEKPHDPNLSAAMTETLVNLVREFNADVGYTQSDEITLVFKNDSASLFDGRVLKIASIMSAACSVFFTHAILKNLPHKAAKYPIFDAHVFPVPNMNEAVENLLWRQADASRNSLTMLASAHFTPKELHKAGSVKKHDMLHSIGINWNDFPVHFKRGIFARRFRVERNLTFDELSKIPVLHQPQGPIVRSEVRLFDPGVLSKDMTENVYNLFCKSDY